MKLWQFRLMVRCLHCMDEHLFGDLFETDEKWMEFRDNPPKFLIHNSGPHVDAMWEIIRKRYDPQEEKELQYHG